MKRAYLMFTDRPDYPKLVYFRNADNRLEWGVEL
jgi:hypothetical protein